MLIGDGHNRDKIQLLKNRAQNISNGLLNKKTEEGKLHFASELWVCLPHTYWPHTYLFFPHCSTNHVLHWLRMSWVDICVGGTKGLWDLSISKPVNQLPLMNSPEVVASVTWTSDPLSIPCFLFLTFFRLCCPGGETCSLSYSSWCMHSHTLETHLACRCCVRGSQKPGVTASLTQRQETPALPDSLLPSNGTGATDSMLSALLYDSLWLKFPRSSLLDLSAGGNWRKRRDLK